MASFSSRARWSSFLLWRAILPVLVAISVSVMLARVALNPVWNALVWPLLAVHLLGIRKRTTKSFLDTVSFVCLLYPIVQLALYIESGGPAAIRHPWLIVISLTVYFALSYDGWRETSRNDAPAGQSGNDVPAGQ